MALLAFNKIVVTHPFLVSQQEDVILECIDSEDITIRIKALDLVQGMVSSDNLVSIVSRLMKQLRACQPSRRNQDSGNEWVGDSDDDNASPSRPSVSEAVLPEEYQVDIIGRILKMCSQNNYSSVVDFDWYIDVLTQLVRMAPAPRPSEVQEHSLSATAADVAETVGSELRNVAVKVRAMRGSSVRAADLIVQQLLLETPPEQHVSSAALKSIVWMLGEYAVSLADPDTTIGSVLRLVPRTSSPGILTTSLQTVMKIFALIAGDSYQPWTAERKSRMSLLIARIVDTLESLAQHPSLEVQEGAVEFVELLRLTSEAVNGHAPSTDEMEQDPPLLLTQAIPSLFAGWELNSVAIGAQANVPMPDDLNLDEPIHPNLEGLLAQADMPFLRAEEPDEFDAYYNQKPAATSVSSETALPAIARLGEAPEEFTSSYQQQAAEETYLDPDILARRKAEREERTRDDPFYIGGSKPSTPTPIHRIIQSSNETELDIDSIPIMQLDIDKLAPETAAPKRDTRPVPRRPQIVVDADETLSGSGRSTPRVEDDESRRRRKGILRVPASALGDLNLEGPPAEDTRTKDDEEMARAMKEVERLRLEMQRANERVGVAEGVDAGGTVVKKKTRKKKKEGEKGEKEGEGSVVKKKKKKKRPAEIQE